MTTEWFDEWDGDGPSIDVECRRCGRAGLAWEHDGERWVLLDHRGEIHRCDPKRLAKSVAADFDDISTGQDHS